MNKIRSEDKLYAPRGKALFEPFKRISHEFGRACILAFIWLFGGVCNFLTQASSPDYRKLFWECLVLTIIQNFLGVIFFRKVRHWLRWVAMLSVVLTAGSLIEMLFRVFLGIRLF